jgi:hypothetical protein
MKSSKLLLSLVFLGITTTANANTRNASMGGVGVSSGDYLSAATKNPSLLADYKSDDDFAISLPSINGVIYDSENIVDQIDLLQSSYNNLDSLLNNLTIENVSELKNEANKLGNYLQDLQGDTAEAELEFSIALSIPNKYISTTMFAKTTADIAVVANVEDEDIDLLFDLVRTTDPQEIINFNLDDITSSGIVVGAAITDIGMAFGKKFTYDRDCEKCSPYTYNIGLTTKYQKVETFNYIVDIENFDEDEFNSDEYTQEDSAFNLDLGFSMNINDNWKMGLVGQNLIKKEYKTVDMRGHIFTYAINPLVKVGGSYNNSFFTAAIDIDLTKTEKFNVSNENQFVRVGMELNGYDWAQIRVGYRHDLKDNRDGLATFGLGFSPWNVVHLDFAVMYANENEIGAGVEFSMTL